MTENKPLIPMDLQFFAEEPAEPTETPKEEPVAPVENEPTEPTVETEPAKPAEPAEEPAPQLDAAAIAAMVSKAVAEAVKPEPPVEPKEIHPDPQVAVLETALNGVVAEKLQGIPETIQALMPDNLSAVEKLAWIDKAAKAVPAEKPVATEPTVVVESIGKPTPVETQPVDIAKMSAPEKLSSYFSAFFAQK